MIPVPMPLPIGGGCGGGEAPLWLDIVLLVILALFVLPLIGFVAWFVWGTIKDWWQNRKERKEKIMVYWCNYCLQEVRPVFPLKDLRCRTCENIMIMET